MTAEWEPPGNDAPGTPQAFGRQLRAHLGGAYAGLDGRMIALLGRMFEIPGIAPEEQEGPHPR